jgi:hypothetical protein
MLYACTPSQSLSGIVFETGPQSGKLLLNGDPFTGSAETFWKMRTDSSRVYCGKKDILVVSNFRNVIVRKVVYGIAVFSHNVKENYWLQTAFIVEKDSATVDSIITALLVRN